MCRKNLRRNQRGSILLTASIAVAVVAIMIMGMLTYISEEFKLNIRSHKWAQTLNLAEAGVEMAFAEFNNYYMAGSNAFTSARGWSDYGGGSYVRYVSYNNNYGEYNGVVYSYVQGVGTANPYLFAYGGCTTVNGQWIYRAVQSRLANSAQFPAGMVAKFKIDMNGNNVYTDSYDSTDPSKSTSNMYDATKKQAHGDIASNDTVTNTVDVAIGNANVYGQVLLSPSGSVTMGPSGSIGSSFGSPDTTVTAAQASGAIRNDFAVNIPDVVLPSGASSWSSSGSLGNQTLTAGSYKATDITLTGSSILTINGNVTLYLTDNNSIKMTGNGQIVLAAGATLTVYAAGSVQIAGNGVANNSTSDMNLRMYGLNSSTSWDMSGNGVWSGLVYAPYAALTIKGGGVNGDMSGAIVAKSITMTGQTQFHYDEALRKTGPSSSYDIASWKSYRWTGSVWVSD